MKTIRATAVGLAAALAIATAGCGTGDADSTESLTLWVPPYASGDTTDEELWEDILAPFEEEHGVTVDVTVVPWDSYEEKFLTGTTGDNGPDVGYVYNEMLGDYIDNGMIADLTDYVTDEDRETQIYLDSGVVDGKQIGFPFVVGGARALYYNKDILAEAGVDELPATWDEFRDVLEQISDNTDKTPFSQPWGASSRSVLNGTFFPWFWQAGGELFTDDGTATAFNSEAGVETVEYLLGLYEDGLLPDTIVSLDEDQARQSFYDGDVAFLLDNDKILTDAASAGIDYGVIESLEDVTQATFVAVDELVAFEGTDTDLASDLIHFLVEGDNIAKFHEVAAYPPVGTDEEYSGDPQLETLYTEDSDLLQTLPVLSGSTAVYDALYQNLQEVFLGQKTVEEALTDAQETGDAALASAEDR